MNSPCVDMIRALPGNKRDHNSIPSFSYIFEPLNWSQDYEDVEYPDHTTMISVWQLHHSPSSFGVLLWNAWQSQSPAPALLIRALLILWGWTGLSHSLLQPDRIARSCAVPLAKPSLLWHLQHRMERHLLPYNSADSLPQCISSARCMP